MLYYSTLHASRGYIACIQSIIIHVEMLTAAQLVFIFLRIANREIKVVHATVWLGLCERRCWSRLASHQNGLLHDLQETLFCLHFLLPRSPSPSSFSLTRIPFSPSLLIFYIDFSTLSNLLGFLFFFTFLWSRLLRRTTGRYS